MIRVVVLGGAMAGLLFSGAAQAQTAAYTWTGYGVNVAGSSKCPTYKMVIDVTVRSVTSRRPRTPAACSRPRPISAAAVPWMSAAR